RCREWRPDALPRSARQSERHLRHRRLPALAGAHRAGGTGGPGRHCEGTTMKRHLAAFGVALTIAAGGCSEAASPVSVIRAAQLANALAAAGGGPLAWRVTYSV